MTEITEQNNLQHSIDRLNTNIEQLTKTVANGSIVSGKKDVEHKDTESGKNTSRVAVTGALSLIGFKLGGLIGAKLGFLYNIMKDSPFSKTENINTKSIESSLSGQMKHIGIGGLIGGAIGTVALGVIGWTRGNRIKDPGELLKHPFESLGKIFGEEPKKNSSEKLETDTKLDAKGGHAEKILAEKNQQKSLQVS